MKSSTKSSKAGYWMLFVLAFALALPPVVGHYMLKSAPVVTEHADASAAQ